MIILYTGIYIYVMWDCYRTVVDLNKCSLLSDISESTITPFEIDSFEINYVDKKKPWVVACWSMIMPGIGQLLISRLLSGFFLIIMWVIISYFSNAYTSLVYTFIGDFYNAKLVSNTQWLLYLPSIYIYSIYGAYTSTIQNNKLFNSEQSKYLKENYQSKQFVMPI